MDSVCLQKTRFRALSGPTSHDIAILSLRYLISRDTCSGRLAAPRSGAVPPPWYLVLHRHIRAIPDFATYRAIIVRYPTKTSTKTCCDTVATSVARYEKYRCWASKFTPTLRLVRNPVLDSRHTPHGPNPLFCS